MKTALQIHDPAASNPQRAAFASTIAENDDAGSITVKDDGTAASSKTAVLNASYPGGKRGAGVYQSLINLIPPHTTYIETHLAQQKHSCGELH